MGEGQPKYSTLYSNEHMYKYRPPLNVTPGLFVGDDRDVLLKSWKGLQLGTVVAIPAVGFAIDHFHPDGPFFSNLPYNSFKYGLPCVIAGGSYGLTVGLLGKLRDKSDVWNHICAGVVSGQMLGAWYKSVPMARWYSFVFAATGSIIKAFADNDILYTTPRIGDRYLNFYRLGLFTKRPPQEGVKDI